MNRLISFLMLVTALFMVACSSDDEMKEKPVIESSMFQGEWFSEDNYTYLQMTYSSFSGCTYEEIESIPEVGVDIYGKWLFYPENSLVRMSIQYSTTGITETRDYKVISIDDNMMVLYDMELNAQYSYHKVVSHQQLEMGRNFNVNSIVAQGSSYSSTSSFVAKVDGQGRVVATGPGTAYIGTNLGGKVLFIRVDVDSRVDCYAIEMLSYSIDDIIEKYGTPDFSGPTDTPTMVISYTKSINDASMSYIHYRYDEETREITEISMFYSNNESYKLDFIYLQDNYYPFMDFAGAFATEEWFANNIFYIHQFENDSGKHLLYNNMYYRNIHGYV